MKLAQGEYAESILGQWEEKQVLTEAHRFSTVFVVKRHKMRYNVDLLRRYLQCTRSH